MRRVNALIVAALGGAAVLTQTSGASADTVAQALALACQANPEINSARASTRANDETVPIARSGLRPIISAFSTVTGQVTDPPRPTGNPDLDGSIGLQIEQDIFQGFRVRNAIRESEAGVLASRELLRNTVQNVLFDAAQAYMDVIRDTTILDIRRSNVLFLGEQVNVANERFSVGENTQTDVAQTRARLASAQAEVSLAQSNLAASRALYRQLVGADPNGLVGGFPFGPLIPSRLQQAVVVGQNGHPVILASVHQADAQSFEVKQIEGELLPSVSVQGTLQHNEDFRSNNDVDVATVTGRISVPIYQGGAVSARVRQAKEQYGQRKIEIDLARDQVRAAVVTAWAQREAARGAIAAAREGVEAAEVALSGAQEEQQVGQRTALDVLDQQQELLNVRETLIVAERNQVVSSFALLSAMGRLSGEPICGAGAYDPVEHYTAVRDKWYGLRTPDGR